MIGHAGANELVMVFGVLSDTHGNRKLMHQTADLMVREFGVELIFHLGDDYDDGEDLAAYGHTVFALPGLWCPQYLQSDIPKRIEKHIEGLTVAAAHAEKDLTPASRGSAIILTGHTHEAGIEKMGMSLRINPGHLKSPTSRGERASFAVVSIDAKAVEAVICEIDGRLRLERKVSRKDLA